MAAHAQVHPKGTEELSALLFAPFRGTLAYFLQRTFTALAQRLHPSQPCPPFGHPSASLKRSKVWFRLVQEVALADHHRLRVIIIMLLVAIMVPTEEVPL